MVQCDPVGGGDKGRSGTDKDGVGKYIRKDEGTLSEQRPPNTVAHRNQVYFSCNSQDGVVPDRGLLCSTLSIRDVASFRIIAQLSPRDSSSAGCVVKALSQVNLVQLMERGAYPMSSGSQDITWLSFPCGHIWKPGQLGNGVSRWEALIQLGEKGFY